MTDKIKTIATLLCACALEGCETVPSNTIIIPSGQPGKEIKITGHKNIDIEGFEWTIAKDGTMTVKFKRWNSTNDPTVISKAGAADVSRINALGGLLNSAVAAGKGGAMMAAPTNQRQNQ